MTDIAVLIALFSYHTISPLLDYWFIWRKNPLLGGFLAVGFNLSICFAIGWMVLNVPLTPNDPYGEGSSLLWILFTGSSVIFTVLYAAVSIAINFMMKFKYKDLNVYWLKLRLKPWIVIGILVLLWVSGLGGIYLYFRR